MSTNNLFAWLADDSEGSNREGKRHFGKTAYRLSLGLVDPKIPTISQVQSARVELTQHVLREAATSRALLKFGWVESRKPVASIAQLRQYWGDSQQTGADLPVSVGQQQGSLLITKEARLAFSFLKAAATIRALEENPLAASLPLVVGMHHTAVAEIGGLSPLAVRLLEAHTIGQSLLVTTLGLTPLDETVFCVRVLVFGIADALIMEAEDHQQEAQLGKGDRG